MKYFFRVITSPSCWFRLYSYSEIWDETLNNMLDKPFFSKLDRYTVDLNGVTIWISNRWYACCASHNPEFMSLPSRRTVFRFFDVMEKEVLKQKLRVNQHEIQKETGCN